MAFLERKWVLALIVLVLIVGYNGVSAWIESRGDLIPVPKEQIVDAPEVEASSLPADVAEPAVVTVHICGAVNKPGVYSLSEGSRINDALQQAGGFASKADMVSVNLAELLTDGQQIVIYELGSEPQGKVAGGSSGVKKTTSEPSLPVSINKGSMEALMLLDGIGEKTAQKILDYRKSQGGFKTIEELKNVPGIGDKKFEQIKNDVKL